MKTAYFKYIFSLLLFGSNGIVANFIDLSSYEIVLLRTFLGSLLLIVIFFFTREKPTFYRHKKQANYRYCEKYFQVYFFRKVNQHKQKQQADNYMY